MQLNISSILLRVDALGETSEFLRTRGIRRWRTRVPRYATAWAPVFCLLIFAATSLAAPPQQTQILPLTGMGESGEAPVHWQFKLDKGRGAGAWTRIRVPSCWELEGFGAYFYGGEGRHRPDDDPIIPKETAIYKRAFSIPTTWTGRAIHIVFAGVMTDATVRINGQPAGATHQGGFYKFSYNITRLVRPGTNDIEVEVAKESSNVSVNFAERRGDYWTFGGIYRPVWLEARPMDHIAWTAIDARADGSFYARVHLDRAASESSVEAQIVDSTGRAVGEPFVGRHAQGDTLIVRGTVPAPRLWTAETPHLYSVRFSLRLAGDVRHELTQRFGFRTLEVRPRDGVYLNGRKIVLKGINRHSFAPKTGRTLTRAESLEDVRLMKEANMNAVRMSHYPPDTHFLEAADELGLYVLDELAGWQGSYDTPSATRLIGQIVRRDVNHPSILFWDNGNEGGWNREVDGEFDRWDPQRRPVLHPWGIHSGINTDHYENYESTVRLSAGPDIFMPTEFLHGLYDGGIGAGLHDYWAVMGASPTVAGAFFWVFSDEGVVRTDQGGRIDNRGNLAPDGIVGPARQKEGSFMTVKQIWSPVQIRNLTLSDGNLQMWLENRYDFTDLARCTFQWRTRRMPVANPNATPTTLSQGRLQSPTLAPGEARSWSVPVPVKDLRSDEVLELSASDSSGRVLWTWPVLGASGESPASARANDAKKPDVRGAQVAIGRHELRFDPASGELRELQVGRQRIALQGPRLAVFKHRERRFESLAGKSALRDLTLADAPGRLATARYDGPLREVSWSLRGEQLVMSYEIAFAGPVDILGVYFDFPRDHVLSKRWLGMGPYRTWANRVEGGQFDVHEADNVASIPGETYAYPEFDGFFADWRWLNLRTRGGVLSFQNVSGVPFHGLYGAGKGIKPVIELPPLDVSFLHVIPAIGTKFDLPEVLGPQSRTRSVDGVVRGEIAIILNDR